MNYEQKPHNSWQNHRSRQRANQDRQDRAAMKRIAASGIRVRNGLARRGAGHAGWWAGCVGGCRQNIIILLPVVIVKGLACAYRFRKCASLSQRRRMHT